jgi:hypothetical protein
LNSGTLSRFALTLVMVAAVVISMPGKSLAQTSTGPNEYAKIMAHLIPAAPGRNICTNSKAAPKCNDMVTKGKLFPDMYYAFVVVTDADRSEGLGGVEFGIEYNQAPNQGVDVFDWILCATLEFPQPAPPWPSSRGGTLVTWDPTNICQRNEPGGGGSGVVSAAGYFYLAAYSADVFKITVRPISGTAKVATCAAEENIIEGPGAPSFPKSHLGFVSFSEGASVAGYNPCGVSRPVQESTWGEVKNHDKDN